MHKFYRSVLLTGMVAVGLAGCGDDVTIVEPPPPPPPPAPTVKSITVAPNGATVAIGKTIAFSAAVVADSGVATTVTWSSSDPSKATINAATGVATGVSAGTVAITATSTVRPTVSGNATLTVAPAPAAATISINSVTNFGGAPVVLANVAGQINVALNLERGGEQVQSVKVFLGTKEVGSQNFAAPGDEPAAAVEVINIPVNTAAFNAQTGVAEHFNGNTTLSARVITAQNQQGSASPSLSLTLNNANTFAATAQVTGGFAAATSAAGFEWRRGGLVVSVLPVVYTQGVTISTGTATFGSACDASGIGARTVALVAPAAGTFAWTATFSSTATAGAGNVTNYELNSVACPGTAQTGEGITVTASGGGNPVLVGANVNLGLRLDNRGPGAPQFAANPNGRQNGWINATVGLTGQNNALSLTSNSWLIDGTADVGVGGYVRQLRVGTGGGTVANANAATPSATPALPDPSATSTSYCAVASATDLLGNSSALPANTTNCAAAPVGSFAGAGTGNAHLQFGVDIAPPTIAYHNTSLAANARLNGANVGGEFVVTVADTGLVGNSGMLAGSPVRSNVIRRTTAATTTCVQGTVVSGVCTQSNAALNIALPLVSTTITGQTTAGYYTHTAVAIDAAGNVTPLSSDRVIVYDATPATATNPSVPAVITGAFSAAAFLNDNLSIRDYFWTVGYNTALFGADPATIRIAAAPTIVDAFNAATLTHTNFGVNSTINTFLGLQATNGGNVPQAYAGGSNPMNALNLFVRDQAQPAYSGPASSPVAPTAPAAGIAITNVSPAWTFNTFTPATSNSTVCVPGFGAPQPACGATPANTVLSVVASGTTATFPNPFARVDFYAPNAAGTDLVLIGSVPGASATLVDNGAIRNYTYSLPVTGAALYAALGVVAPANYGPFNVYAFGVSSSGFVALISQPVAQTVNAGL